MIVFITATETDLLMAEAARAKLPAGFPTLHALTGDQLKTDAEVEDLIKDAGRDARVFIVRIYGGAAGFTEKLQKLHEFCQREGRLLIVLPVNRAEAEPEIIKLSNIVEADKMTAFAYTAAGGAENDANFLRFVSDTYLGTNFGFAPPSALPDVGLYHPRSGTDKMEIARMSLAQFQAEFWQPNRPVIAVMFYQSYWQSDNLAAVDAIITEIERRQCNALPVFCHGMHEPAGFDADGVPNVFTDYLLTDGKAAIDCVISTLGTSVAKLEYGERATESSGSGFAFLEKLDVPFIQAVHSATLMLDEWERSEAGITAFDAMLSVVMPEFDGRIISKPYSFLAPKADGANGGSYAQKSESKASENAARRNVPLVSGIREIVALAVRHATLRHKPNAEKRLVIELNNVANSNARIGNAYGLDSPAAVLAILRELKAQGYLVENIPPDGDALMFDLIAAGTYDRDFLTAEQMRDALAKFTVHRYREWFKDFPEKNQRELQAEWDAPPGAFYVEDGEFFCSGLQYGNVLVMIQPSRGFDEDPDKILHSGDLVPTHQYLGFYRWLRDEFKIDAMIRIGKHGTLEWLPGKGNGLSESCYPALGISDFPVFYTYIIDNAGEGTQAKRRMQSCIIDHLTPPLQQAETYGELEQLIQLLNAYVEAQRFDPKKLDFIQAEIWKAVKAANLQTDLSLAEPKNAEARRTFIERVHGYLHELGDAQIRDGLHVFAAMPEGEQLIGYLLALVRLDSPATIGLRCAVANDLKLDYEQISEPAKLGAIFSPADYVAPDFFKFLPDDQPRYTNGDVLRGIETLTHIIAERLAEADFDSAKIAPVLESFEIPAGGDAFQTLKVLCETIVPSLRRTTDEMTNLLRGLDGRYVPAGPSGAPTRGMYNILPSGRNFYSVDVRAVPSPFSWQVGQRLGDALLNKYLEENGAYPENVGISMWGTSAMRTHAEDVAEFLWLIGVRPVWQRESLHVVNLEIIPLDELKRPRIDVTARLSGLFRDAFPGLMKMMNRAVQLVMDLDEPEDQNYLRRNALAEERRLFSEGNSAESARRRARFRLFSNKPGAYGAGVVHLIETSNWEMRAELANNYMNWGGYAYDGAEIYGEPAREEFRRRLAVTQVAAKNHDNHEHDMFDNDDYYDWHGGMIAAITSLTGSAPQAFVGDSSDPEKIIQRDLQDEANRVFRARVVNPKWIESVKRHGYKGGMELTQTVEFMFGFDALADIVHDWMYEQIAETFVFDENNRAFAEKYNPWALREMAERLLEAATRGMWENPNPETIERLRESYLQSEGVIEAQGEEVTGEHQERAMTTK